MKFNFYGDLEGLIIGIDTITEYLGFKCSLDGKKVEVKNRPGNLEVIMQDSEITILFDKKIHFFRALGLLVENMSKNENFHIVEEPQFSLNGVMFDVSRNAVINVDTLKKYIEIMAVAGLNMIMLYTEDTYEIKSIPYFGYMRGRYTHEELKEIDDYAYNFGIEVIPCIQTLAHLFAALKWGFAWEMKDTNDILLVGKEETYKFIEEMIASASAPFRSNRIHLGMDEAHALGLGKYLDINGYRRRFDIMSEHLERVRNIAINHGLKPMMWSDMYFRLASKTGLYYDTETIVPDDVIETIPKDVQLVYWDYYHDDKDTYKKLINNHKKLKRDVVFAGGIWLWNGIAVNYVKTFNNTNAALAACKEEGVKEVFATMWGDNGAETDHFSGLLGIQLFAEHGYSKELDMEKLKSRFEFCTGGKYEAFFDLGRFDEIEQDEDFTVSIKSNPSKFLLWQDILIGLFDKNIEGYNLPEYYSQLAVKLSDHLKNSGKWHGVFDMYLKLARVLEAKSEIGILIKRLYDENDIEGLKLVIQEQLSDIHNRVYELKEAHKKQWFKNNKPFGWEVIDMRYGGLLARIETCTQRLHDYINGTIDKIEELEAERLYFDGPVRPQNIKIGKCNAYNRIVSASPLGHNS